MKTKKINNRTIIGIVCIVLALVVTFGVSPLVNRMVLLRSTSKCTVRTAAHSILVTSGGTKRILNVPAA